MSKESKTKWGELHPELEPLPEGAVVKTRMKSVSKEVKVKCQ